MALTTIPHQQVPAFHLVSAGSTPSYVSALIDAVGESVGFFFRAPLAGTIAKVGFRNGTHNVNGAADVRIETPDSTTGNPSGTLWGTNTNGAQTVNASNSWFTTTLTAGAVVAKGDKMWVVISVAAASALNTNINSIGAAQFGQEFPYTSVFNTGAWIKNTNVPVVALEYSGGAYNFITGVLPYSAYAGTSYGPASTPDERGNQFTLPYTCRVYGAYAYVDLDVDADLVLYGPDGTTVIASATLDLDERSATTPALFNVVFPEAPTLTAGLTYYLTVKPANASVSLAEFSTASLAIMQGAVDGGSIIYGATKTDGGAFTPSTTTRAHVGLVIDQQDFSGGFKHHPGMSGFVNA